jgi:hypothetical protein
VQGRLVRVLGNVVSECDRVECDVVLSVKLRSLVKVTYRCHKYLKGGKRHRSIDIVRQVVKEILSCFTLKHNIKSVILVLVGDTCMVALLMEHCESVVKAICLTSVLLRFVVCLLKVNNCARVIA